MVWLATLHSKAQQSVVQAKAFVPCLFNKSGDTSMKQLLVRLWREEEGQDLTEYALLLVLLTLAAIGSLSTLATAVNGVFVNVASNLNTT